MRPISLHGHSRAITMVRYNAYGDLLFTVAKDQIPMVWNAVTGQRLGTYEGHKGAVWACDVNAASTRFASASGDQTTRIWEVETGECLAVIEHPTPSRGVCFSHGDRMLATITDASYGKTPSICIYNLPEEIKGCKLEYNPCIKYEQSEKITHALFGPDNTRIYMASDDGAVSIVDVETGKELLNNLCHDGSEVRRINWDSDMCCLATASLDKSSKLLDARDLSVIQTYKNDFPVNEAIIVNNDVMNHVIMGGGIDAQSVTNVGGARNKFEIKFMHKIFGEELGSTSGHFGPVNTLAVEPNGKGFVSGGEDGFVNIYNFDPEYFSAPGRVDEYAD